MVSVNMGDPVKACLSEEARPAPAPDEHGSALLRHLLEPPVDLLYATAGSRPEGDVGPDEKWIHDVRVATRRLQEALELAAPLLKKREHKERVTRRIRRLRRDLGAARELDVVWAELQALTAMAQTPARGISAIEDYVEEVRRSKLEAALTKWSRSKLEKHERLARRLLKAPHHSNIHFRDLVAGHLYQRCRDIQQSWRPLEQPNRRRAHHRLRIKIKRLRYAIELGAPLLESVMDPGIVLRGLKRHQDALGELNDAWDLLDFVRSRRVQPHLGPAAEAVEEEVRQLIQARHQAARSEARQHLRTLVSDTRGSAGRIGQI
ncbi:MAG: CHAD domain-containing protein [Myxococcota bacterium]